MFCCSIELRPDGNHHPPVHGMNRIDHRFRIREMCLVELMASPCVFRPVAPVEHNVVYRNFPVTETFQRTQHFILRLVTLPALPIAHRPFRHDGRLACQGTVTADYIIHIITGDKIIVQLRSHFTPPRLVALLFRVNRTEHTQPGIRNRSVRIPFHLQRHTLSGLQIHGELIAVRIPCRAPALRNHQFVVDIHFGIACIIEDELEFPALRRLNLPFISDL